MFCNTLIYILLFFKKFITLNLQNIYHLSNEIQQYTKNIYDLGLNPGIIKQLLGHSLTTTERYLSVSEKELLEAINKLEYTG